MNVKSKRNMNINTSFLPGGKQCVIWLTHCVRSLNERSIRQSVIRGITCAIIIHSLDTHTEQAGLIQSHALIEWIVQGLQNIISDINGYGYNADALCCIYQLHAHNDCYEAQHKEQRCTQSREYETQMCLSIKNTHTQP